MLNESGSGASLFFKAAAAEFGVGLALTPVFPAAAGIAFAGSAYTAGVGLLKRRFGGSEPGPG